MALADNTERIVEQMRLKTRDVTDQRILNDAFIEFEKSTTHTRKLSTRNNVIRRFAGIAAAAAIAVVIWSVYAAFFNHEFEAPKQIFDDLAKTENVSIAMYNAVEEEPFQQIWASKPLEMTLMRTTSQNAELLTLWDISRNNKMTSKSRSNPIEVEKIEHNKMLTEMEESMFYVFSLNSFRNINSIPKNARLAIVKSQSMNAREQDKIYELTWHTKNSEGDNQYFKWRIILDGNNDTLKATELYLKNDTEEQYNLAIYCVISYPAKEDIRTIILKDFDVVLSPPQYLPTGGM